MYHCHLIPLVHLPPALGVLPPVARNDHQQMPSFVVDVTSSDKGSRRDAHPGFRICARYHLETTTPLPPDFVVTDNVSHLRFRAPLGGRIQFSNIPQSILPVVGMLGTLFSDNLAQLGFDSIIRPQEEFSANSTSASVIVQLAQPEPSPVLMGSDPAAWGVLRRVEIGVVAVKDTGAAISIDLHEDTRRLFLHFLQSDLLPTFPFVFHGPLNKHIHEDTRYLHSIASSLNKISGTFGSSKALLWRREIKSLGIALHHLQCQVEKRTDDVLDRSNGLAESAPVAPKQSFNAMFVKAGIEIGLSRRIKKIPKLSGGMNDDLLFDDMGLTPSSAQMYSVNEAHKALSVEIEAADSLQHIRARAARSESPMEIMSDHGSILNDGGDCEEDVEMLLDDDEI